MLCFLVFHKYFLEFLLFSVEVAYEGKKSNTCFSSLKGTTNSSDPDGLLIGKFKSTGDLEYLGQLYEKYMHLVFGVCLKYLKDREASRDATMQIFEKLIIEIPKREIDNFKPWLHVITRNHCLMQLRSEKSRTAREEKALEK
jgi:hypothetical protein